MCRTLEAEMFHQTNYASVDVKDASVRNSQCKLFNTNATTVVNFGYIFRVCDISIHNNYPYRVFK